MLTVITIATVSGLLVVCYAVLFSGGNQRDQLFRYSVVVEGGSTVSRIHVYTYEVESGKPVSEFRVAGYYNERLHPGLSTYAGDPHGASISLKKLLETAKGRILKRMWKETQVRLMATAGTRLLKKPVQEKFLKATRGVLESSGFMFQDEWASITSASEEDVNAWVVTNLALGSLGGDPLNIRTVVEVIEASRGSENVFAQGQTKESNQGINAYVLVTVLILISVVVISLRN